MSSSKFFTINPSTNEILGEYAYHSPKEIELALENLTKGYRQWSKVSLGEKVIFLKNLQKNLLSAKLDLATMISSEMGKKNSESLAEIEKSAQAIGFYADNAEQLLKTALVGVDNESSTLKIQVELQSLGIIWAIMPWNFPLWQFIRCAVPAWLVGNVVLLKHSEITAGVAQRIEKIVEDSSSGVVLLKNLRLPHTMTENILAEPRIRGVSFTGSVRGGSQVATLAGKYLKKSVMELGGSDPYLVLHNAPLDLAVNQCVASRMINMGQSCVAAKRFFVHAKVYDQFLDQFRKQLDAQIVGAVNDPNAQIVSLAAERFAIQLKQEILKAPGKLYYQKAMSRGGAYFPPTILEMNPVKEVWNHEYFGPIACVWRFTDFNEAITQANNSVFGLGAAVFTEDLMLAHKVARELDCGMVAINDMVKSDVKIPFGGVKSSGFGRELSQFGLFEFANIKALISPVDS